ncbi:MAG TPA: DUF1573 domain-containing protein [Gemmataceae bacterium]|nr:DUF1573 domain-containing protein [Gemmataceae bacterium]
MIRYSLTFILCLTAASAAGAASWADAMFDGLSRDFGSVPRGPMLTHSFRLTNQPDQAVHIACVRVSCGCVSASASNYEVPPGGSATINAQMDTTRFAGVKAVTIYVQFDRPQWEEVRLWVQANSRDDVQLSPNVLAFGQTKKGTEPTATIQVSFYGHPDWKIQETMCDSNYVQTQIEEIRRQTTGVNYKLTAKVRADTPVGKWYTDVWVKTNNPTTPRLRIPLTIEVESALTISPNVANLGQIKAGAETERKVIVRGVKPFRITEVTGTDDHLKVQDSSPESKPVHVLTVTLKGANPGDFQRTLKVLTDLKEEGEIEFQAVAKVMSESGTAPK